MTSHLVVTVSTLVSRVRDAVRLLQEQPVVHVTSAVTCLLLQRVARSTACASVAYDVTTSSLTRVRDAAVTQRPFTPVAQCAVVCDVTTNSFKTSNAHADASRFIAHPDTARSRARCRPASVLALGTRHFDEHLLDTSPCESGYLDHMEAGSLGCIGPTEKRTEWE